MRREYYVHEAKDGKYHVAVMRVLPNGQWWLWSGTWNRTKPACWCGESYDFDAYPHNSDDVFDEEQFLGFLQAVGEENVIIRGVKLDEIRRYEMETIARVKNREVREYVRNRTPFRGSNLSGGYFGKNYVVLSYLTPIFVYSNGQWYINTVLYGPVTARHKAQAEIPKTFETSLNGVDLSFAHVREYERTKHVHRLHPYLGKFIPQLVEVFLKHYFKKGDWILDPFLGSGTTLIEANVLGIHSVGIEISEFNCLIAKVKTQKYDIPLLEKEIKDILFKTKEYSNWLSKGQSQLTFLQDSFKKYKTDGEYLNTWLSDRALQEILFYRDQIKNYEYQDVLKIILSRATRSARLVPHYDLARPKKPVRKPYYCIKHKRVCQPVDEAMKFINRYSWDTIRRIKEFDKIRTDATMKIIQGDSREVDFNKMKDYKGGKFDGIFTSPPYVGLIDYHDQHRYAYELFGFSDNGFKEIGPASKGRSREAKEEYKKDIIAVFQNMNRFLKPKAKIFVVVNDRDNLYPEVAAACGYKIEKIYHRPVLMRTERDNTHFSESIYYFIKQS